jgi:hypothetical protein
MDALTKPAIIVQNVPVCIAKQKMLKITDNKFDPNGYWDKPIAKMLFIPTREDLALFDQNGYDLTTLEQHFAYGNCVTPKKHRDHISALKQDWFTQDLSNTGPVLNHSLLFERKAYTGEALSELKHWAKKLPLIHKVIAMRPKWGLDFSMDYVDDEGNAFEILHWEWDSFNYEEICAVKDKIEPVLLKINWDQAAQDLIKYKDNWHSLNFFDQSDWKCNFFGIPKEQFKMVIWR